MNGFAEVSAMEMEMVNGGQQPDMYGSTKPTIPEPGVAKANSGKMNPIAKEVVTVALIVAAVYTPVKVAQVAIGIAAYAVSK